MKNNLKFDVKTESLLLPFLLVCFNKKSRNYVKGILKRGQVMVDGKMCKDFSQTVSPGQCVEILMSAPEINAKINIPILFEDDDILVIDKPAGMLSISTDTEHESTAYHIATDHVKSRGRGGRVFIVHRLDRETSGIMLFAKNERTKLALQDHWDELALRRGYIAVVEGKVSTLAGQVKSWLKQTKTLLVYSSEKKGDGKLGITNYRNLQTAARYSLLDISLETGRKNQIRVHMSDIGHPIVGDKKYGAHTNPANRLCLHASELIIKHPSTGEQVKFESKMPDVFRKVMRCS